MSHTWVTGEVITARKLNQLEQTTAAASDTADWARDKINVFDADGDGVVDEAESCLNVAESIVSPIVASETEYPTIIQGEKVKISFGKIIKWMSDARTHFKSGLLTIGNNLFTVSLSGVQRKESPVTSDDSLEVATTAYVKNNLKRYSASDNGVVDNAAHATDADSASTLSATLPLNRGGTGATTAADARDNLGLGDICTIDGDSDTTHYLRGDGTWATPSSSTGGVVSVSTGAGLTGGPITSSGTIKAQLKSETASSLTAASRKNMTNREFPVGVDANGDMSVNVPINEAPDYNSSVAYTKGTMVFYPTNGYTYRCKQNTTAGTAPTNTMYWEKKTCGEYCAELNSSLPKLLWTNSQASGTGNLSEFSSQKVSLDTTQYDIFMIETCRNDRNMCQCHIVFKSTLSSGTSILCLSRGINQDGYMAANYCRELTFQSNGITFTNGYVGHAGGNASSEGYVQNGNYLIPIRIYGIKL